MRSATFDPEILRRYLRRHKIAPLPELKQALGTPAGLTVFRKLRPLGYLSSYSHRGQFYQPVVIVADSGLICLGRLRSF